MGHRKTAFAPDDAAGAAPDHPLFPVEEGDDPRPIIRFITIARWENGKPLTGGTFPAAEIVTTDSIAQLYGGGDYLLSARHASKNYEGQPGNLICQRKITIPGRPRPMGQNPTAEEHAAYNPPSVSTAQPASATVGGDGMNQLLMAMLNQQTAQAQQARESAQASQQMFMTMMVQLLSSGKSESAEMTKMMLQMNAQQSQNMMQMMTVLMSNRGGGPEELAKYAELLRGLNGGAKEEPKEENFASMLENAADVVTGLAALKNGMAPGPNGPQQIAGEGSAASVLTGGLSS